MKKLTVFSWALDDYATLVVVAKLQYIAAEARAKKAGQPFAPIPWMIKPPSPFQQRVVSTAKKTIAAVKRRGPSVTREPHPI